MELRINHRPACDILLISGTPTAELLRADTPRGRAVPRRRRGKYFPRLVEVRCGTFPYYASVLLTPRHCRLSVSFNYRARRPSRRTSSSTSSRRASRRFVSSRALPTGNLCESPCVPTYSINTPRCSINAFDSRDDRRSEFFLRRTSCGRFVLPVRGANAGQSAIITKPSVGYLHYACLRVEHVRRCSR